MNGEDEDGDDDGVDVAQPHERRVQLVQMFLVDVVHESLPAGFGLPQTPVEFPETEIAGVQINTSSNLQFRLAIYTLQSSEKRLVHGLVKFVPALACLFCLALLGTY